ncbi:hypothetical protein [Actinomyces sp. MRS3W]|uniref:hypothetical protein n=1 Tax=Actinomyces sp. MRS3W TaxID=2800796 RepID=UPI0028FD82DF|nr:hypothetical protein [Actinomyces sp. MRS3W]MDU0349396.1 hypothetical protein [Actinomyces sp. MRS3W]
MTTPSSDLAPARENTPHPSRPRRARRLATAAIVLTLAVLPLTGCGEHGQRAMRAWLTEQQAVDSAEVYCTSHMETGCSLHADVVLVPDTSAEDAAAIVDAALEEAMQNRRVNADYFQIGLEWVYDSAELRLVDVSVPPRSTDDSDLTPQARALRLELIGVATDLAGENVASVEIGLNSIDVERGEVDAVPARLLSSKSFSDSMETTALTDNFTFNGWDVEIISAPDAQPPASIIRNVINNIVEVPLPDGTDPALLLDTTDHDLVENPEPRIQVRRLPRGADYLPETSQAAPVLAAIAGTPYFADVALCERREYGSTDPGSGCVFYDLHDGVIDRDDAYPSPQAQEIYDAAQQL